MISREHDNSDAIISVQEIIGSDQITHDWNSDRVAPEVRKGKPAVYSWQCRAYCFARLSLTMATGPSKETTICCHPCAP